MQDLILKKLTDLNIENKTYYHEPVFTVEQALQIAKDIPAAQCKNLFLKDSKNNFYLFVALHDSLVNLKKLSKYIKAPELRFADANLLKSYLGVEPGSVTPFGLIFDKEHKITVLLDSKLFDNKFVSFHPLVNSATTVITSEDLKKFIESCQNIYKIINLENID